MAPANAPKGPRTLKPRIAAVMVAAVRVLPSGSRSVSGSVASEGFSAVVDAAILCNEYEYSIIQYVEYVDNS